MREATAAVAAFVILAASARGATGVAADAGQSPTVRIERTPAPRRLPPQVRRSLSETAFAVRLPDGNEVRFRPARRIPVAGPPPEGSSPFLRERLNYRFRPGALIGVLDFSADWSDARGQQIPAGRYALAYAVQPSMKEHRGVSEFRDVLILVAPEDIAGRMELDRLADASRRISRTGHPAVLELFPAESDGSPPRIVRGARGRLSLEVRGGGAVLALGLIAPPPAPTGPDPVAGLSNEVPDPALDIARDISILLYI